MKTQITKDYVDYALKPSIWDMGNDVLYSLCREHPRHDRPDAIVAKIWLIGRSYAAAIERRKNAKGTSDNFYEDIVAEYICNSEIDLWLDGLPERIVDPWSDLGQMITVHKHLVDSFLEMTGLEKRSLASKYLHFHRPDLFFIYDSRAKSAVNKVTPRLSRIREISAEEGDSEYLAFCRRVQFMSDNITERFGKNLTPRQLDKILLRIMNEER